MRARWLYSKVNVWWVYKQTYIASPIANTFVTVPFLKPFFFFGGGGGIPLHKGYGFGLFGLNRDTDFVHCGMDPGVLRYNSDRGEQCPFWGVDICDSRTFFGLGILQWLFLGKRLWCGPFWGVDKKHRPKVLIFMSNIIKRLQSA